MRTIVVVTGPDGTEKLLSVFTAPETIIVPLADALGKADLTLDSPMDTNTNLLHCDATGQDVERPCRQDVWRLPRTRQTGVNMRIALQYSNRHVTPEVPEECDSGVVCLENHVGPVCKVVISVEADWQSRTKTDCDVPKNSVDGGSSCTFRYYQGIKISFSSS